MQQFDDGMLRAYLDGDATLDDATRTRIAAASETDAALAGRIAELRADIAAVDTAFAAFPHVEPDAAHLERALHRARTRIDTERHTSFVSTIKERFVAMTNQHRAARNRRIAIAASLGAVALVLLLVFAPVGGLANTLLDPFRYQPTKFAVITVKTSDFPQFSGNGTGTKPAGSPSAAAKPAGSPGAQDQQKTMQDLAKYVTITSSLTQGNLPGREVKTAADAKAVVNRDVVVPAANALPKGIANTPRYYVSDAQTVDGVLHLNEIRPLLTQAGMASAVSPTAASASFHVDIPAASIVSYGFDPTAQGDAAKNQKGVAVIAFGAPTITTNGIDIQGVVDTITALPNISPELAAQLKKADLQHTLIVPVTDQQTVENGTINNAASTTISQKDGSMTVVLLSKNNMLYAVVGTYDAATVKAVAQGLSI